MIHPHTEIRFVSEEVGHGLFATAPIPRGTLTWVQDQFDREFSPQELDTFDAAHREVLDRYCYRNAKGHYVFCWDHGRFMNHSFRPNCLLTPYRAEVAIRDIAAGEELTNDYGCLNIIESFTPGDEGEERKTVQPDDLARFHTLWDAQIGAALEGYHDVPQPLARFLSEDMAGQLHGFATGKIPQVSVSSLLYSGKSH